MSNFNLGRSPHLNGYSPNMNGYSPHSPEYTDQRAQHASYMQNNFARSGGWQEEVRQFEQPLPRKISQSLKRPRANGGPPNSWRPQQSSRGRPRGSRPQNHHIRPQQQALKSPQQPQVLNGQQPARPCQQIQHQKKRALARPQTGQAHQKPVQVQQKPTGAKKESARAQQQPARVQQQPAPGQQQPARGQQQPAQVRQQPAQVRQQPVQVRQQPAPVQQQVQPPQQVTHVMNGNSLEASPQKTDPVLTTQMQPQTQMEEEKVDVVGRVSSEEIHEILNGMQRGDLIDFALSCINNRDSLTPKDRIQTIYERDQTNPQKCKIHVSGLDFNTTVETLKKII